MDDDDDAYSIKVRPWPEPVLSHPQIYVGDVRDGSGLHYMVEMTVLEALPRRPRNVSVTLHADGAVGIIDDGGPFPVSVERAVTRLMIYEPGLLSVIATLSSRFDLRLWQGGDEHLIRLENGRVVAPLVKIGPAPLIAGVPRQGSEARYLASTEIFGAIVYDRTVITRRLGDLAQRHPEVHFTLV